MDKDVKADVVTNQYNKSSIEADVLTEGSSGASSTNVGTKDEAVAYAAITYQQNEEDFEAEVLPKVSSGATEDMYVYASARTE